MLWLMVVLSLAGAGDQVVVQTQPGEAACQRAGAQRVARLEAGGDPAIAHCQRLAAAPAAGTWLAIGLSYDQAGRRELVVDFHFNRAGCARTLAALADDHQARGRRFGAVGCYLWEP